MSYEQPIVMGILNITPDSFYDSSRTMHESDIISRAGKMLDEGADILDIGGYSSRPGAEDISASEELGRVSKALELIKANFPHAIISVDTFRSDIAKHSLEIGAHIINDISGGQLDEKMLETVGDHNAPYICMHMRGTPQTMKELNQYDDLIGDIQMFFSEQVRKAEQAGIKDIILDPGFGFSKNIEQNFELMRKLSHFQLHEKPVLVGISRKSMIYKPLGITPSESLNGTTVLNTMAIERGAQILRVHDVKAAKEAIALTKLTLGEE